MEAKDSVGVMVTLTYDTYIYDNKGNIIGENLPSKDIRVSKKDAQNFIKRLRAKFPDKDIKYLLTAEYGKRTHRPHYHALLFGFTFDDIRPYKKSKRGNYIYRSPTLEKIWHGGRVKNKGICTVDCIHIGAKVARYCTKYCAKDYGIDDTFMLFSRGIGENRLLKEFNGKSYWIEGREYPIPKKIWQLYIENKYKIEGYSKYINFPKEGDCVEKVHRFTRNNGFGFKSFKLFRNSFIPSEGYIAKIDKYWEQSKKREFFSVVRDNDPIYCKYIKYWKDKTKIIEKYRPSILSRILSLDEDKYLSYRLKAIDTYNKMIQGLAYIPPRSNSRAVLKRVFFEKGLTNKGGSLYYEFPFAVQPRHNTANDNFERKHFVKNGKIVTLRPLQDEEFEKICPFD